jgi:predicted esterase
MKSINIKMEKITVLCFHGCNQNKTLFQSLMKSLQKNLKQHDWCFIQGFYKIEEGFGWYTYSNQKKKSKVWKDGLQIDIKKSEKDKQKIIDQYKNKKKIVLIGFSEGGQFALDLSRYMPNVVGVVALSPSYQVTVGNDEVICPVVLVTSSKDCRVARKYSEKWKKLITGELKEWSHPKGHKVYLPKEIRDLIKKNIFE